MELFRFLAAGSVDDGKSTLIGHLLHLVKALKQDQVDKIKALSNDGQKVNYAWFTDGLSSERELGITIDVSYTYFSTHSRRFIIADCPGHAEYTRNMFTGASTADLLILMVNAENGITEQTRRHLKIAQLLMIPKIMVCINKMDLVDFSEGVFSELKSSVSGLINESQTDHFFIPISASGGDNLLTHSANMQWYKGKTVLNLLNSTEKSTQKELLTCFPVQQTVLHDKDAYVQGNAVGEGFEVGEELKIWPDGDSCEVLKIYQAQEELKAIDDGQFASLLLSTTATVNRGNILFAKGSGYKSTQLLETKCCWMDEDPLDSKESYILKLATLEVFCEVKAITESDSHNDRIELNAIFLAQIRTTAPILSVSYSKSRTLGAFILINSQSNKTVAAGTIM